MSCFSASFMRRSTSRTASSILVDLGAIGSADLPAQALDVRIDRVEDALVFLPYRQARLRIRAAVAEQAFENRRAAGSPSAAAKCRCAMRSCRNRRSHKRTRRRPRFPPIPGRFRARRAGCICRIPARRSGRRKFPRADRRQRSSSRAYPSDRRCRRADDRRPLRRHGPRPADCRARRSRQSGRGKPQAA